MFSGTQEPERCGACGYGQGGTVTDRDLGLGRVDQWAASLVDQAGYF